jgi:hypothetical protein
MLFVILLHLQPGIRRSYCRSGPLPDRASSGHVTDVTSGQKATLRRILRNFRLHMRRTYQHYVENVVSSFVVFISFSFSRKLYLMLSSCWFFFGLTFFLCVLPFIFDETLFDAVFLL